MMKTSVAMCTYNGEKFLKEQMDSILLQTVQVNEIVVCDDGSTDTTQKILQTYAERYPGLFRIYLNENNLGSVKNFEKAIALCENEIIFLSDQDDIWMPTKVENILEFFKNNTDIDVVATEGFGIDEEGKNMDVFTIWQLPRECKERNIPFNYCNYISFNGNIATGASMALRKSFLNDALPFPLYPGYHHDEWLAFLASDKNSFTIIPKKLFKYRKHPNQQVGGVFYPNDIITIDNLTNFINFDEHYTARNFSYYKKTLKCLSTAHKKYSYLSSPQNINLNTILDDSLFKRKRNHSKKMFKKTLEEFKSKYPLGYRILRLADMLSGKRQL